jgi:hypothetical protein
MLHGNARSGHTRDWHRLADGARTVGGGAHSESGGTIIEQMGSRRVSARVAWTVRAGRVVASAGPRLACVLLAAAWLVSGCAAPLAQPEPEAPGNTPVVTAPRGSSSSAGSSSGGMPRFSPSPLASPVSPDALVARATVDAAQRSGVQPEAVRVELVEAREWPDRSLGCPQPNMGYAQSITPGYLIVVEAAGKRYRYHTDHVQVDYCDAPS